VPPSESVKGERVELVGTRGRADDCSATSRRCCHPVSVRTRGSATSPGRRGSLFTSRSADYPKDRRPPSTRFGPDTSLFVRSMSRWGTDGIEQSRRDYEKSWRSMHAGTRGTNEDEKPRFVLVSRSRFDDGDRPARRGPSQNAKGSVHLPVKAVAGAEAGVRRLFAEPGGCSSASRGCSSRPTAVRNENGDRR